MNVRSEPRVGGSGSVRTSMINKPGAKVGVAVGVGDGPGCAVGKSLDAQTVNDFSNGVPSGRVKLNGLLFWSSHAGRAKKFSQGPPSPIFHVPAPLNSLVPTGTPVNSGVV